MANLLAIHSVGNSLRTFLERTYPPDLQAAHPCSFALISSGEMNKIEDPATTLSLYLYRVCTQDHARNAVSANGTAGRRLPLSLDLHYLLTVWAGSALTEQVVLAWTLRQFHRHPILDGSSLSTEAGWGVGDSVQLIPSELSTEEMMRVWDALEPAYHLSVGYVARAVLIDPDAQPEARPVVATRHRYRESAPESEPERVG
jgi:Pvc16 N-terminal domain